MPLCPLTSYRHFSKTVNVTIKGINDVTVTIWTFWVIFIKKKKSWFRHIDHKFGFVSELVIYDALRSETIRRNRHRFRGHGARSDVRGYLGGQGRAEKCAEGSSKLYWGALLTWSQPWGAYVCVSPGERDRCGTVDGSMARVGPEWPRRTAGRRRRRSHHLGRQSGAKQRHALQHFSVTSCTHTLKTNATAAG